MITATASPNIAIVKYWGKQSIDSSLSDSIKDQNRNLAINPSLSLTLSRAQTRVEIHPPKKRGEIFIQVGDLPATLEDCRKILSHLERVFEFFGVPTDPTLEKGFKLLSVNNFPTATGIASSASAFAALTLGFAQLALGQVEARKQFIKRPEDFSMLARRGSGSACRSVLGPWVYWEGEHATRLPCDWKLHDTILILSKVPKKISSSQGHQAATSSPLLDARLKSLPDRISKIKSALERRSLADLGPLIEEEALEMHAVARSGNPPADYFLPETLRVLQALPPQSDRDYFFTIDAGPNIHFLSERPLSQTLINLAHQAKVPDFDIWEDFAGSAPKF